MLITICTSLNLHSKIATGCDIIRIRRTFKDFQNLCTTIKAEFGYIDRSFNAEDSSYSPKELLAFIKKLLNVPELNQKINAMHKFFEISMISFNIIEEPIVKQLNASKKSGLKNNKSFLRKITSFLE